MFAVVGVFEMAPAVASTRERGVEQIASRVRHLPGFVAGYWSESHHGTMGHTYIVFELRHQAEEFAASVKGNAANQQEAGVKLISTTLAEITASAHGTTTLPRSP